MLYFIEELSTEKWLMWYTLWAKLCLKFLNLIGTANSKAVEVNSLTSGKLPGLFLNEQPGYKAKHRKDMS